MDLVNAISFCQCEKRQKEMEDDEMLFDCAVCNLKIETTTVNACNKHYHLECFLCTSCKNPLSTRRYKEALGMPYCSLSCVGAKKEQDKICEKCGQLIFGSVMKLDDPIGYFHPNCFNCSQCGICVAVKTFFSKDREVYCDICYKKELDKAFDIA
jgi:four and a half LIM domains protein 2